MPMERRYPFNKRAKRPFPGEAACLRVLDMLPNVSNCCGRGLANLSACHRITQPVRSMREWKRSEKVVSTNCNNACSSELDLHFSSSSLDEASGQVAERFTPNKWTDSEEGTDDVVSFKDIRGAFAEIAEAMLRALPHWYPRSSANCFLETLKRLSFESKPPVSTSIASDPHKAITSVPRPLGRPISFCPKNHSELSTPADPRYEKLNDISKDSYLTDRWQCPSGQASHDGLSETSALHEIKTAKKLTHQSLLEDDDILSPLGCQWQPGVSDSFGREIPAKCSHLCDYLEPVNSGRCSTLSPSAYLDPSFPIEAQSFLVNTGEFGTAEFQNPAVTHVRAEVTTRSSVTEYLREIDMSLLSPPVRSLSTVVSRTFEQDAPSPHTGFRFYQHRMF